MKKLFILAAALCVSFTVFAQTPQSAKEAAQAAQEACDVWGKKAEPANNKSYSGAIYYESKNNNGNSSSTTANGKVEGQVRTVVARGSAEVGGSYNNSKSNNNESRSTGTLYYDCK